MWATLIAALAPAAARILGMALDHSDTTKEQKAAWLHAIKTMNSSGQSARLRKAYKKLEERLEK